VIKGGFVSVLTWSTCTSCGNGGQLAMWVRSISGMVFLSLFLGVVISRAWYECSGSMFCFCSDGKKQRLEMAQRLKLKRTVRTEFFGIRTAQTTQYVLGTVAPSLILLAGGFRIGSAAGFTHGDYDGSYALAWLVVAHIVYCKMSMFALKLDCLRTETWAAPCSAFEVQEGGRIEVELGQEEAKKLQVPMMKDVAKLWWSCMVFSWVCNFITLTIALQHCTFGALQLCSNQATFAKLGQDAPPDCAWAGVVVETHMGTAYTFQYGISPGIDLVTTTVIGALFLTLAVIADAWNWRRSLDKCANLAERIDLGPELGAFTIAQFNVEQVFNFALVAVPFMRTTFDLVAPVNPAVVSYLLAFLLVLHFFKSIILTTALFREKTGSTAVRFCCALATLLGFLASTCATLRTSGGKSLDQEGVALSVAATFLVYCPEVVVGWCALTGRVVEPGGIELRAVGREAAKVPGQETASADLSCSGVNPGAGEIDTETVHPAEVSEGEPPAPGVVRTWPKRAVGIVTSFLLGLVALSVSRLQSWESKSNCKSAIGKDSPVDRAALHSLTVKFARNASLAGGVVSCANVWWDPCSSMCSWEGISCTSSTEGLRFVTAIKRSIWASTVPAVLGNLAQLTHLDLSQRSLTGTLPVSIANLKKLEYLDLAQNPSLHVDAPVDSMLALQLAVYNNNNLD
jgi:hypothetical protein